MPKAGLYIMLVFLLLIEVYVFNGLRSALIGSTKMYLLLLAEVMFLITLSTIASTILFYKRGIAKTIGWINILVGLSVAFFATKMVYMSFLFLEDIYRLGDFVLGDSNMNSRSELITIIGLIVSLTILLAFLHGVFVGRYNFKVKEVDLSYSDLPSEFDGFKIVQFSDLHSGSFDSDKAMQRGIDLIQNQNADIILFTGDLVNNLSEEFAPYIGMFKKLSAPFGKFSILGNHDYGLYVNWASMDDNLQNQKEIRDHHKAINFDLLNNTNRLIEKNGQTIRLVGVENWGRPPFPPKGDLNKALEGVAGNEFKVLMSHDPHHWDDHVVNHENHVHLTLSGHTHGMQFGIDLPKFKFSIVKFRYPKWMGLYKENNKYLYVNRGFGHLGFPGRVGIMPEVTVINLKKTI
jgi:predicted MPP superfamily phosphohydrolase